jgi:hemerythrin
MTGPLIWRDDWLLGIDRLDADHRKMVRLMNALFCAAAPGAGGDAPGREHSAADRLGELIEHLRAHFSREETFLQSIRYPGFQEHKTAHSLEMAELTELRRLLWESGADSIDEETAAGLKRWFLNHVVAEDQSYANYYFRRLGRQKTT